MLKVQRELKKILSNKGIKATLKKIRDVTIDNSDPNDFTFILEGELNELLNKERVGTINSEEISLGKNKIRKSIIEIIKNLNTWDISDGIFIIETNNTKSNNQSCYYKKIETNGNPLNFLQLVFKPDTEYVKIGFKFLKIGSPLFSKRGKIICENPHSIIHISKNTSKSQFKATTIINGQPLLRGKGTGIKYDNEDLHLTVFISIQNSLEFYLNDKLISKFTVDEELRKNVYLMAWGDKKHEYKYTIKALNISSINGDLTDQFNQVTVNQSSIKITSNKNGDKINRKETITGEFNYIPKGYILRLLVFHGNRNEYWPMGAVILDNQTKTWAGNVTFGSIKSTRSKFRLKSVLITADLNRYYDIYLKNCAKFKRWDAIKEPLPSDAIVCQKITVSRYQK